MCSNFYSDPTSCHVVLIIGIFAHIESIQSVLCTILNVCGGVPRFSAILSISLQIYVLGWDDFKANAASYCPICPTVYSTVCTQMVTSPINGNPAYEVCCLWDFKLIGFPCLSRIGFFGLLFMGSISPFLGGFSAELFNKFT